MNQDMQTVLQWAHATRQVALEHYFDKAEDQHGEILVINSLELLALDLQPVVDTVREVSCIYEPRLRQRQGNVDLLRGIIGVLWTHIATAARSGLNAKRLADFVIGLHDLEDVVGSDGHPIKLGSLVFWRDLPDWPWLFGEWGIDIEDPKTATDPHGQAIDYLRATTFAATLLSRLPDGKYDECGGMPHLATICLEDGLEKPYEDPKQWRAYLKPAATWILIAGQKIRQLCFQDIPAAYRDHATFHQWGDKTFCPERWDYWRKQFWKASRTIELETDYRDIAEQAMKEMDRLDREA